MGTRYDGPPTTNNVSGWGMQEDRRRVWPRMLAWLIVLTVIFLGAYYALTGYLAYRDLQSARSELMSARDIATVSPGHAQLSVENATASAQAATERLDGPLWSLLIAIPVVGDSPEAARELTGAFADAMLDSGALAVVERVEIGGMGGVQRARPNQGAPRSNHVSWFVRNARVSGALTSARSTRLRGPMRRRTGSSVRRR